MYSCLFILPVACECVCCYPLHRFMLRVFFGVLGIVVTTDGFTKISRDAKVGCDVCSGSIA